MNTKALITLSLALLSTLAAHAGGSDRGGGNAVVCFNMSIHAADILNPSNPLRGFVLEKHLDKIESITTYDLVGLKGPVTQTFKGESPQAYTKKIANRYRQWFPGLAKWIEENSMMFYDENTEEKASPLYRVYDENDAGPVNPEYCVISTMAVQADIGAETYLTLDSRLFGHAKHSALSRNVLYLHEYLYRSLRTDLHDESSVRTRALVQLLVSAKPYKVGDFANRLRSIMAKTMTMSDPFYQRYDEILTSTAELWLKEVHNEYGNSWANLKDQTLANELKGPLNELLQLFPLNGYFRASDLLKDLYKLMELPNPRFRSLEGAYSAYISVVEDEKNLCKTQECSDAWARVEKRTEPLAEAFRRAFARQAPKLLEAVHAKIPELPISPEQKGKILRAAEATVASQKCKETLQLNCSFEKQELAKAIKTFEVTIP